MVTSLTHLCVFFCLEFGLLLLLKKKKKKKKVNKKKSIKKKSIIKKKKKKKKKNTNNNNNIYKQTSLARDEPLPEAREDPLIGLGSSRGETITFCMGPF